MNRILSYLCSLGFLAGFLFFDVQYNVYDAAVPYFAAILFAFWSPKRIDVIIVSILSLLMTIFAAYFCIRENQPYEQALIDVCLSVFALICIGYVSWHRQGVSLRLKKLNVSLEERFDLSQKETTEIQSQLTQVASELDQHTADRNEKEREFRETIASYQSLIESLPINVLQKDRHARLTFGNQRFFKTLQKTKQQCIGKTDFDLFPKVLAEKYAADDQKVMKTGKTIELVEEHINPAGEKSYVQVFKAPIRNNRKQVIGVQGMFWDVTDRIRAEKLQKEADANFRSLVDSNIMGIFTADFDGRIQEANGEFLEMLGYSTIGPDVSEMRWDQITPGEFNEVDQTIELEIRKQGFCRPLEKEFFHKDGSRVAVLVGAVRLGEEKNEFICSVVDISKQKEAELALKTAKEAADELLRSKSLFLANMSHEIRTPLNGIIGMTELVLQTKISRDQQEYLRMVKESGESLLEIINDLLDFSKVQAGKLKLEPTNFSLRGKIADTLRPLSLRAYQKDLKMVCDVEGNVPDRLFGDHICLRQVLTNLASNAIKFTDNGEVVITVHCTPLENDFVRLHISVVDTGLGIDPKLQRKIFNEFEQADNTSTREYGGIGLGLAICVNLVDLLEGKIWVESEVGKGSTFHFTSVWKQLPNDDFTNASIPSKYSKSKILVIDEHLRSLEVLKKTLVRWDLQVTTFVSTEDASNSLSQNPDEFSIMILDEKTAKPSQIDYLRAVINASPEMKTILLSNVFNEPQNKVRVVPEPTSPVVTLIKPVKETELLEAVQQILSGHRPNQEVFEEAEPTLPSLKILLAEDNAINRRLAMAILSQRGHDIYIVKNGSQAVELAKSDSFDLILMDIQMPQMDGFEATQQIRRAERGGNHRSTIVALTAHAGERDRLLCDEAGMDGYITKPLRPRELMLQIKNFIRSGDSTVLETNAPISTPSAHPISPSQDGIVDLNEALAQAGGDRELLQQLVSIFFVEMPVMMTQLESAVKNRDYVAIRAAVHRLKASFRLFSCRGPLAVSQELETIEEGVNPDEIYQRLKIEYGVVWEKLKEMETHPSGD